MANGVATALMEDKICRDFLRKVCRRGDRCKYIHPKEDEVPPGIQPSSKRELFFCHDYQNGLCPRKTCRFIHCTVGEEEYYLQSGHVMPHILEQAIVKGQIIETTAAGKGGPVCKDFLMGECQRKRGGKCKFRHLTKAQYEQEIYGSKTPEEQKEGVLPPPDHKKESCNGGLPEAKRQRFDKCPNQGPDFSPRERDFIRPPDEPPQSRADMMLGRDVPLRDYRDWDREMDRERDREREIIILHQQLESLKKENATLKKDNSDLKATNDFLLDKVSKGAGTVTTVAVPTVSLAPTIPVATSVRPLTAAQVSHPLSITSECSVGCSVGSVVALPPPPQAQVPAQSMAPPTQQVGVAPPPTAVLGSVGGVQVSLSQAPTLTAVTLSSVGLAPIAPVSSIAPTANPNLAQAISGAKGRLVTYPIMTQPVLRPQLQ